MNIFKIIKKIIVEPNNFFKRVAKGKSQLKFAFGYFALLSLFRKVITTLFSIVLFSLFLPMFSFLKPGLLGKLANTIPLQIFYAFLFYLLGLGFIFVTAGIVHLWIKLFKGTNTYSKTFELLVYSGTPSMLLSWIPFLGFIANIWSLILLILGTAQIHKMDRVKAVLIYVIPLIALMVIGAIVGIIIFILFMKNFATIFN